MIRITNKNFSLEQICESGQCFRFQQVDGDTYGVTAFGRYLEARQEQDEVTFFCPPEEYEAIWSPYFDMETDYGKFMEAIDEEDGYLNKAARFGWGIRILEQDTWETVISFIISQQNNIKRIRKCIETLSLRYGEKKLLKDGRCYYAFPSPQSLAEAAEEELRDCGLGYRSRYIRETARSIVSGDVDLASLKSLCYEDAKAELLKLSGIGGKVADCICLFALHKVDAFPIDTHIKQVFEKHYPKGFPYEKYSGFAGIIQQYIFYYDLKNT